MTRTRTGYAIRGGTTLAFVGLVLAMLVTVGGVSPTSRAPGWKAGVLPAQSAPRLAGQIAISEVADIRSLDPKTIRSRQDQNVVRLIFDSLYHRDNKMQIVPWLATSYENPNEQTWRFHLRRAVKFHNGNDFKANDVKFSLERLMESDATGDARVYIERVVVVDDYAVDIITKKPYAALLTRVVLWHMTDEEYFKQVGAQEFSRRPIGTGPFKFVEWVRDERVVLEASPDYWRGAPRVQRVIFRPIPEAATRIAALGAGQTDIVAEVPPSYAKQPGRDVKVVNIPGTRVVYLGLNVKQKPFDDMRVRQAMNYAVDLEAIIRHVLDGQARKIDNPLLPEAFGYTATPVYGHDRARARTLFTEAGYPSGFEMQLDTQPPFKQIAEALAGQLRAVGVRVNVNIMEVGTLYDKYEKGGSQTFLTSWGNSESDADGTLSKQLWSQRANLYTGYTNSAVDASIEAGATTIDPEKRKRYYATALRIIVREAPWVFLYNPYEIFAHRNRVRDWVPRPDALFNLDSVWVGD